MDDLTLAAEFPAATRDAWLRLVDGVLKGADFEKKLVARSHDGLRIEPLYEKAAPAPQPGRAASGPWRIAQRMDHPDPAAANALALADLDGGADALVFSHAGAAPARGFGVKVDTIDDLERALEGVMLDLIAVRIETAPFAGRAAAEQWSAVVKRRGVDPAALDIDFGLDPAGDIGRTGEPPMPFKTLAAGMAETTRRLREAGFAGPTARVDTRAYHEAGASEAQELAAALATGVAYLRALESAGLALAEARRALSFLMVADADEFLTVAKLRALRRLWARVEEACGVAPEPIRLHAETAWRMATRRDPWVNLLRGTIAAFSAGIGGADGVTVLPFTAALGLPDAFARRLARNTQLILLEEFEPLARRRSGGRQRRLRGADRGARREGLDAVPGAGGRRRHRREPRGRGAPGPHRRGAHRARARRRDAARADHRHERVPEIKRGGGEGAPSPPLPGGEAESAKRTG